MQDEGVLSPDASLGLIAEGILDRKRFTTHISTVHDKDAFVEGVKCGARRALWMLVIRGNGLPRPVIGVAVGMEPSRGLTPLTLRWVFYLDF